MLRSMLDSTFDRKEDLFGDATASQIMVEMTQRGWVELESPLSKVIDVFGRTRFAFVPVISTIKEHNTSKPVIVGTLTIRDFLPLIVNHDENKGTINQISSPIVSVSGDSSIKDAISIMVNKGIRNIGIRNCHQGYGNEHKVKGNVEEKGSKIPCIVNDRKSSW